jgi:hypothetical protein
MEGEKVAAKLNRLLEKYGSNKRAYAVITNVESAVRSAYSSAEECQIGRVLDRIATLRWYHEYCVRTGLPDEVCTAINTALWVAKTEIPEILREKCGCTVRR